jgi:hypothetical protein
MRTAVLATSLMLGVVGCEARRTPVTLSTPITDANGPVLLRVEGHDQSTVVNASPRGPIYTVEMNGQALAQGETLEEIRRRDPALHRMIETRIVGESIGADARVDAGVSE